MTGQVMIARLKPERVAEYLALHEAMDASDFGRMAEAGIRSLRIYRLDLMLVMIVAGDLDHGGVPEPGTPERARFDLTEACFAQSWQVADEVFRLPDVGLMT